MPARGAPASGAPGLAPGPPRRGRPAAPTKAALLFDMLVSCASIQGISWLEAAGAIAAENQVLRLIADRAGLPESAGGCFVSGGSAANLSALLVAREAAKRRAGESGPGEGGPGEGGAGEGGAGGKDRAGRRWRVAVSSDAHSSIAATLRILEMDALAVHGLGRPVAARPGGVHSADGLGRRDRGQVRVPAPAHFDGPGSRDPRPDAVTLAASPAVRARVTRHGPAARGSGPDRICPGVRSLYTG
jgi:Pyridoxal-dependent decarboxylase conserved domain